MKLFNTSFVVISLILFTVCVSNLFGQDVYNSPDGLYAPGYDKIVKQNFEGSIAEEEFTMDNTSNINRDPSVITDEYGSNSFNRAVNFGTGANNRYVSVPSHVAFTGQSGDGSIEMWVYPTDLSHGNMFFSKGNTLANTNFYLAYSTSATARLFFRIGGANPAFCYSGVALTENTWQHIAVTWLISGGNYTCRFYINGVLVATDTDAGTWFANNDPVIIGGNPGSSYYTEGLIDEVRFWGSQRTTTQIRDNRFVGLGDFGGANSGNALTSSSHYAQLLASWTFNFSNTTTAYDDIGGHHGTYAGGSSPQFRLAGQPIPYNLALYTGSGGASTRVEVPHNSVFTGQTGDGSVEMWVYPTDLGHANTFISRGPNSSQVTFHFGHSTVSKLFFRIGSTVYYSGGTTISANTWTHLAVTWVGGPNFTVRFYKNGVLAATSGPTNATMNTTSTNPLVIGGSTNFSSEYFEGYMDEVRFWQPRLTDAQVRNNMIVSGRIILPNSQLLGCWNFDSHLGNWSAITGINGTFNVTGTNNARLSGYSNETSTGAYSGAFDAHTTTINDSYVNQAYFRGKSGLPIPDASYVQDTIHVDWWNANVTNVRALVSIQHSYCADLDIRLYAPNMTYRDISTDNGGTYDNGYLTIFYDGHSQPVTSTSFLSPWSNQVKPEVTMGNFGGSPVVGNWILRVTDDDPGITGTLMGWGLRFNSASTTVSSISSNVPGEYKLHQNYPNPFNPVTNINFDIPKDGIVSIKVYDITGREISTLVNKSMEAGSYNVEFDASNFASGTYFYKITSGDFTDVKKMMLVK